MRKILVCILAGFLLSGVCFSREKDKVTGRVSNHEGKPLVGVKVEVLDTDISTETHTDGTFTLKNIERKKAFLLFSHPDYVPQSIEIDTSGKTVQVIVVSLAPKSRILMTIKEEITVTAEADSIIDISLPSHRTILPSSVLTEMGTSNIAESVDKIPGVVAIGKGGYSMVPAIRGLAEHRVLLLMDGVRIPSERRVGASASFISLNDIDRIEVNRGPYSVFYGSGAVGGIINVVTKSPTAYSPLKGNFHLSYNTVKQERAGSMNVSGSLGKYGLMLGVSGKKADDYSSPEEVIEQSRYSDYDFLFKVTGEEKHSRFYMTFFHYKGIDIGKPSPTARLKPRWYPQEGNTLFTLGYEGKNKLYMDTFNASVYVFRSSLETQGDNLREDDLMVKKRNLAEIEGINYGFKVRGGKTLSRNHTLSFGFDFFGRGDISDSNIEWQYDENGHITGEIQETSLNDARSSNFGFYLDDKIQVLPSFSVNIGARFDTIHTSNISLPDDERISRGDDSFSAYIGTILEITPQLSLVTNIGRSFRFPSVSELFYSGLTGRGTVFGNPDLEPEKGLNLDLGLRYLSEEFFASVYGFSNHVSDIIEKYAGPEEEEYFYRNLTAGRINGLEGEFYFALVKNLELFVNFHLMKGRVKGTDHPLNYIPPARLAVWGKYSYGDFWFEPMITLVAAKTDPGPLEVEIDGYTILDSIFGLKVNKNLTLLAIAQNILNKTYFSSADEQGVLAPGRGLVFKATYSF
ncbi:MAG: TonB-dependent receptor [Candidatus Aminicenantes bacterium]|nr:TonB-dependent receptor [Candidatus Aminicenantes bacterium]